MSKHNLKKRHLSLNKIYWTLSIIIIIVVSAITGKIVYQYINTSKWSTAPSKITLADESIDMLYDKSETSRKNKVLFMDLYNQLISKNGDLTEKANSYNIHKLKTYYNNFNSNNSSTNYKKMYSEVLLKYSILEQFDNLFTDNTHTTLDTEVTPQSILDLNNSTFSYLTTLFVQNPDDAFVKRIINTETRLNKDIITLDDLTDNFNQAYSINKKYITLNPGYHKNITVIYQSKLSNLILNWNSTNYMTKLNDMMAPVVKWTMKRYLAYNNYLDDMQRKKVEYYNWNSEKQEFLSKVQATHQAAVEAKHQQEEIAKEQAAAAAKAQADKAAADKRNAAAQTVPNFVGKTLDDVHKWADPINININVSYTSTNDPTLNGTIQSTTPNNNGKVYPGYSDNTINVVVYKYVPAESSSSSQASSSSASSSSASESSSSSSTASSSNN